MYSTVSSLHIALDFRLQQITSNRKQSILPQQYDLAINDSIDQIFNQRITGKLNSRQEGFEESVKRYFDIESLKRSAKPIIYYDPVLNKPYINLPSDCRIIDTVTSDVYYNRKSVLYSTSNAIISYCLLKFDNTISKGNFTISTSIGDMYDTKYKNLVTSYRGSFIFLTLISEYLKRVYNVNTYNNVYDNINEPTSLILVYDDDVNIISADDAATQTIKKDVLRYNVNVEDNQYMGIKGFDLIDSLSDKDIQNDYYKSKNNHLNPTYTISNNKLYINTNKNFGIDNLTLNYIKQPTYVNSDIEQMSDLSIKKEFINLATTNLSGILKDETYQINSVNEQTNN